MVTTEMNPERAVKSRYSQAATARERELCCPVDYDPRYLSVIPEEILERDYGCGDPSKHLRPGETVLDLGSGGGKICYIASQVVGPKGCVIGVDMNDDMLALARKYRQSVGDALGYHNVELRKGKIQDLALDQERLEAHLESHPVCTVEELEAVGRWKEKERKENPMIPVGLDRRRGEQLRAQPRRPAVEIRALPRDASCPEEGWTRRHLGHRERRRRARAPCRPTSISGAAVFPARFVKTCS